MAEALCCIRGRVHLLLGRVVKLNGGTEQLLSSWSAVSVWVLGLSCLGLV